MVGGKVAGYHTGEHQVNKASQVPAPRLPGQQVGASHGNHGDAWSRIEWLRQQGVGRYTRREGASGGCVAGDIAAR